MAVQYTDVVVIGDGTVPPTSPLGIDVIQEGQSNAFQAWSAGTGFASFMTFFKANGLFTALTKVLNGDVMGRLRVRGYYASAWSNTQAEIRITAKEDWNDSSHLGTSISIWVTPTGGNTLTEMLTVDETGITISGSVLTTSEFGDGSDGNVTINSNVTLTKDMNYKTLTVNSTFTLTTAGFKIKAWALVNNGIIDCSGAVGGAGNNGTGAGGAGGAAAYATNAEYGIPGDGGVGEGVSAAANVNGAGKAAGTSSINRALVPVIFRAGSGGGGGGGHGTSDGLGTVGANVMGGAAGGAGGAATGSAAGAARRGAGGGGGGGVIAIWAKSINNAGVISANGGAGGNATTSTDAGGNGGGGGGGAIVIFYRTTTGSGLGTRNVNGGAAGTGGAGGAAGTAGSSVAIQM